MVDGIDEILNKKDKIIIGSMLLFIFSLIFILNHFGYFENSKRDQILDEVFKTSVVEKYTNKSEHMTPMLKLSNGNEMINYFPKHNVKLNIGDSLIKRKSSTDMQVYRNKKLIYSINLLEK
ncbi:hypothetical protein [Flavobacterium sp. LB1P71]|uniref:hypothetical protein n=1 Tax=unclassified Flavobacterium TaxID=196869 RepID=UPI003AAFF52C